MVCHQAVTMYYPPQGHSTCLNISSVEMSFKAFHKKRNSIP